MEQNYTSRQDRAYHRIEHRRRMRSQRRKKQKRLRMISITLALLLTALLIFIYRWQNPSEPHLPAKNTPSSSAAGSFDHIDITPRVNDSEELRELKKIAQNHPNAKKIIANMDAYSADLITLALKNTEAIDFVADYPTKHKLHPMIDLSDEAAMNKVPLLIQWDERWGYMEYGSGLIGWTGCGPTCMAMLVLYLTGDDSWNPGNIAQWSEANGYYSSGNGTAWTFMSEGAAHFGLRSEELPLVKQYIINALDQDHPVVCAMAPGDFTTSGHYIILTGYDENGFTVNDPNSPIRSSQHWTYEKIESQISNLWAFSKS